MTRPILPAAILFTAGAALGCNSRAPISAALLLGILSLIGSCLARRSAQMKVGLIMVSIFTGGIAWAGAAYVQRYQLVFGQRLPAGQSARVAGTIAEPFAYTADDCAFTVLALSQIHDGDKWQPATGRVRLTLAGRTIRDVLPGDHVIVRVQLERPHLPRNDARAKVEYQILSRDYVRTAVISKWIQVEQIDRPTFSLSRWLEQLRRHARQAMFRGAGHENAAMLAMLLLGDRSGLDDDEAELFRQGGLFHLLVISGMHVGLLTAMMYAAAARLGAGIRLRATIALMGLLLFCLLVPDDPPVLRAAWACAIHLGAVILWRKAEAVNTVGVAALLITVQSPLITHDAGYQLTVMATLAILVLRPNLVLLLGRIPWPKARDLLAVSLAAQLGISPLAAHYFLRIPMLSLLPSLLALPFVAAALALGASGLLLAPVFPWGAEVLYCAAGFTTTGLALIAKISAQSGVATITCADPGIAGIILYYAILLLCATSWALIHIPRRAAAAGLVLLIFPLFAAGHGLRETRGPGQLIVDFLDVSNGDAIVVHCPQGEILVFDGGGVPMGKRDPLRGILLRYLKTNGIFIVDHMFLTHPHPDHTHGLLTVLRSWPTGCLWLADGYDGDPEQLAILAAAKHSRVPLNLFPQPDQEKLSFDANARSLVFRICYGEIAILLTGDITSVTEDFLIRSGQECRAQVLKVPHHGSRTSCDPVWLDHVRPDLAVISCGLRNPFGHPHPESMESLANSRHHPLILTTAEHGAVRVKSDGRHLWTETWSGVTLCWREGEGDRSGQD